MASNELDEYLIRDLKQQGAKINVWGVGTNLVTGKEQPALDGIYKLSAIEDEEGRWQPRLKLSEQTAKVTNPGVLQVRRYFDGTFYMTRSTAFKSRLWASTLPIRIIRRRLKGRCLKTC